MDIAKQRTSSPHNGHWQLCSFSGAAEGEPNGEREESKLACFPEPERGGRSQAIAKAIMVHDLNRTESERRAKLA